MLDQGLDALNPFWVEEDEEITDEEVSERDHRRVELLIELLT